MSVIKVLDKQTANLIAAGEVVDRPASVVKELTENSIDAGAKAITVEIKNGGSSLIRITDDGQGMSREDVRLCPVRHATSKIRVPDDLNGITTLGFRGEALASISSISKFTVISKRPCDDLGTVLEMHGDKTIQFDDAGSPDGTTIMVNDIFFNVPARRKFLRRDATETSYIAAFVEKIAVSHPDIKFRFIVDSKLRFETSGNGLLLDAIYSVYGKEFASQLIEIHGESQGMKVSGYVCKPEFSRANRNMQSFFINKRFVRAKTMMFALEEAYKSFIMTEKHPAAVVFLDIDPYAVDVNVHPSKLEVRFSNEKAVFETVYFAVRNALEGIKNPFADLEEKSVREREKSKIIGAFVPYDAPAGDVKAPVQTFFKSSYEADPGFQKAVPIKATADLSAAPARTHPGEAGLSVGEAAEFETPPNYKPPRDIAPPAADDFPPPAEAMSVETSPPQNPLSQAKYIGIIFDSYICVESADDFYLIDKHAAHERIIYENIKKSRISDGIQQLLTPIYLSVTTSETAIAKEYKQEIFDSGFEIEDFGPATLAIRGIPSQILHLKEDSIKDIVLDMLDDLIIGGRADGRKNEAFDRVLYNVACKSAMKAGRKDREEDSLWIIKTLSLLENINYCPHGRPVLLSFSKKEIEIMFKRK